MKVKINDKRVYIKKPSDLTVADYFTLCEKEQINIVDYISLSSEAKYTGILETTVNKRTVSILQAYLSQIQTIDYFFLKKPESFLLKIDDTVYNLKSRDPLALGVRILLQQYCASEQREAHEQALFVVASMLTKEYDYTEALELYEKLLSAKYLDVMPIAGFFLFKCSIGQSSVINSVKRLIMLPWTWTLGFLSKQGVKD